MILDNISKKKKFSFRKLWTSDIFYEFLQKTVFLNISQNTGLENVKFSLQSYFSMLFNKKCCYFEKILILTLFSKNWFFRFFWKLKKIIVSKAQENFFFAFIYSLGPNQHIYAKKVLKNRFRRYAVTLS